MIGISRLRESRYVAVQTEPDWTALICRRSPAVVGAISRSWKSSSKVTFSNLRKSLIPLFWFNFVMCFWRNWIQRVLQCLLDWVTFHNISKDWSGVSLAPSLFLGALFCLSVESFFVNSEPVFCERRGRPTDKTSQLPILSFCSRRPAILKIL